MLIRIGRSLLRRARRLVRGPSLAEAQAYTGTDRTSGRLQLEILKSEGCLPSSNLLEIGCGCLSAGVPLIEYLEAGRYVGIDPNEWLRKAALSDPAVRATVESKRARFLSVSDFDASSLGIKFDYALSHSILTHTAQWQLSLFLRSSARTMPAGAKLVASLRLAEGNAFGSSGTPDKQDSRHSQWVYPSEQNPNALSWFTWATVSSEAATHGFEARLVPEYTERYIKVRPLEIHDWVVLTRQ
jgi:hypothetical protein